MLFDRKPARAAPQEDLANLKITDARAGDALSLSGAADDYESSPAPKVIQSRNCARLCTLIPNDALYRLS